MKAIVFGYREFGCAGLSALLRHGLDVPLVVTHRDDPGEQTPWPSLAALAGAHQIAVEMPDTPADATLHAQIATLKPDFLFSFYYRHLIPEALLNGASRGAFNLHGSLLPRLRGRAPINWALVLGERDTGVTLHYMSPRADAGDIVDRQVVEIAECDTAYTLGLKLLSASETLLDRAIPALVSGTATRTPQDLSQGNYCGRRKPEDGRLDWERPARELYNLVRAVTHPYPGAFTTFGDSRLTVWWALPQSQAFDAMPGTIVAVDRDGVTVAAGTGALTLISIQADDQPEGPASALASVRGLRPGALLGRRTP